MDGVGISDELLIKALNIYQTNRLKQMTEEAERSERHVFSPGFLAKMDKLVRMQKKSYYFFINTAAKRVALVVLLILITMFSTVFSTKALRDPAINFIVHVYEKMSTIIWGENGGNENLPSTIQEYYLPGFLPEGYELKVTEDFKVMYKMKYFNQDGVKIEFQQFAIKAAHMSIDTEGTTYENIKINGNSGIYFSNKGYQNFIWNDGRYGYSLSSKITKEELRKVAESVKKRE